MPPTQSLVISLLYAHTDICKIPTIRQVWQLIQQGDYTFSYDLKDAYLHM